MTRRTKRWWAAAGAGALGLMVAAGGRREASADTGVPAVRFAEPFEKYKLANGLEVILHEDHRTPVVAVNVWYHVGSKDEPAGKNGFAHLFEHVMFQGSRHVPEDTYFKFLERAGASGVNGTTNSDRTNYFETVPSNQLALALWLESDRMAFLLDHADEKTFVSQREVVKNERRQNYENAPYGLVYQYLHAAVFPVGHPYHLLTIGTPHDLDAATIDDVRSFFRTFYVPNNASLVIAGDIDRAKTKALVEQYFGPIVPGDAPPVKTKPVPVALAGETRLRVEAGVELPRLYVAWPTPPVYAPGDAELDVLSQVLTAGKSSRLYKRLVYDMQVAQDVSANQDSSMLGSLYVITITPKKGHTPDEMLALVDQELDKLRGAPPADDEMVRARTDLLTGLVFHEERVTNRANTLNDCNQMTGDPGCIEKNLARYRGVDAGAVSRAVGAYLPKDKRVVVLVDPVAGAPRAGRLVGGH